MARAKYCSTGPFEKGGVIDYPSPVHFTVEKRDYYPDKCDPIKKSCGGEIAFKTMVLMKQQSGRIL